MGNRSRRGKHLRARRRAARPVVAVLRLLPKVNRRLTTAVAVGVLVAAALPALFSLASGALVGSIAGAARDGFDSPAGTRVIAAGAAAVVLFATQQLMTPVVRALAEALGRRVDRHLRGRVMAATLAPVGIAHLQEPEVLDQVASAQAVGSGEITAREAVDGMAGVATHILAGLGSAAVLAAYRWWVAAGLVAVYLVMTRALAADLRRTVDALRGHPGRFRRASYLRDLALAGPATKEVRVFGLTGWLGNRFTHQSHAAMVGFWAARRRGAWVPPAAAVALLVVQGGTYTMLARSAARGEITLGELAAFATAAAGVASILWVGVEYLNIGYGTAPMSAVLALEAATTGSRHSLDGQRPPDGLPRSSIRFEGVAFRYPGREEYVYRDFDLEIPAGRSLAIVGHNGAGKTTLVKLLARLHDPADGRITVDGVDLREIDAAAWQRRIAAIFQDFLRYRLSLAENVGFGAVGHLDDRQRLEEAAARAGIADLLERLPAGWDTVLSAQSPGGVDLSGGQWQRVALARALFALGAGAGILVLDEPTAALDVRAEAAFYDRFLDLTRGVTTVVISHRFGTVRRADHIVVLSGGLVVEQGDHRALLAAGGEYARLFRIQAAPYLDDAPVPQELGVDRA